MLAIKRFLPRQPLLAIGLFLLVASLMAYQHLYAIGNHLTPDGDLAADMLLVDLIRDPGYLLVGHYSRWGFNHPGPFWFYLTYLFEQLLSFSSLWRYQIWFLCNLLFNDFLISAAAIALSRYLFKKINFGFTLFFAATLIGFFGLQITWLWMPWRIVLPYLCFLLSLLHLAEGSRSAILYSALFTGVLIHGYITMPLFTVPFLLMALWLGHRKTRWLSDWGTAKYLWGALGLAVLFACPILLDTLKTSPTNLSRMLNAQIGFRSAPKPGIRECIAFAESLLRFKENRLGWLASLSFLFFLPQWRSLSKDYRLRIGRIFMLCGAVSLLVFGYYPRTPSPLFSFVAQFYVVIPVLFLTTVGTLAFQPQTERANKAQGVASAFFRMLPPVMVSMALLSTLERPAPASPGEDIRQLSAALVSYRGGQEVSLNLPEHEQWPTLTGVILELSRLGIPACTTRRTLEQIVTSQHVCAADRFPDVDLIRRDQCQGACFAEGGEYGIRPFRLAVTNLEAPLGGAANDPSFINWTRSPESTWWSNTHVSQILLNIPNAQGLRGNLEMNLRPLWPQRVKVLWNGHQIFNKRMGMVSESLQLTFSPDWIHSGGNVISFVLPGARQPGNGDLRELAIIVDGVLIR